MADNAETISNQQFAQDVGCHHSMASRLMSGDRLPSLDMLHRISEAYGIERDQLVDHSLEGAEAFGRFLRSKLGRQTEQDLAATST